MRRDWPLIGNEYLPAASAHSLLDRGRERGGERKRERERERAVKGALGAS